MEGQFTAKAAIGGPFETRSESINIEVQARATARRETISKLAYASMPILIIILFVILMRQARTKWPFLAVTVYMLLVVALISPLVCHVATLLGDASDKAPPNLLGMLKEHTELWAAWPFWVYLGIALATALLFLVIPVKVQRERPVARRAVWTTAIAAAAMFALLVTCILVSAAAAIWGDDILEGSVFGAIIGGLALNWSVWSWVFRRFARDTAPKNYVERLIKWLYRGSLLELLIAVPSHIIVRHRNVCCAHLFTALGIAAGLAVALIAYGPGLYFLYAKRIRAKRDGFGAPDGQLDEPPPSDTDTVPV